MAHTSGPSSDPESLLQDDVFVRRLARQLVRDEASSEDLAQATWLQWMKRSASAAAPRAWLATVARRLAGRAHRTRLRREARERMAHAPEPAPSPEQVLAREELRAIVVRAVLKLSPLLRDVVVLRFFEGLPPRAIAERLAVPVETVRTRQKRALQELRERLDAATDGGRVAWCTALLPVLSARAEAVLLASQHAGSVVAKVAAGWAVAAMVVVGASLWAGGETAADREDLAAATGVVAAVGEPSPKPVASESPEAAVRDVRRVEAPASVGSAVAPSSPDAQGGASGTSTARVTAWPVQFLCVGADGLAVAGAEIRLYEGQLYDSGHVRRAEAATAPFAMLVSGDDGRAEDRVPFEYCVAAAVDPRAPERRTSEFLVARLLGKEQRIVLEDPIELTGRALDAAGQPLAGAEVRAKPQPLEWATRVDAWVPDEVFCAADGTFTMRLLPGLPYELSARSNGIETATVAVRPTPSSTEPVVLRVDGRALLHGLVLDEADQPVAGARVHAVRMRGAQDGHSGRTDMTAGQWAISAPDGSFTLEMPRHGPFRLVANKDGFAASPEAEVSTDPARPSAMTRLRLQRPVPLQGRVLAEDGSAMPDAEVSFQPDCPPGDILAGLQSSERFGVVTSLRTAADGSFATVVHPGVNWRLRIVPRGVDIRLGYVVPAVVPGSGDVVVRVPDLALRGCVVRGRVTRTDGEPLPNFKVSMWRDLGNGLGTIESTGFTIDGDRFWSEPLPFGCRCVVHLEFDGGASGYYWKSHELAPSRSSLLVLESATTECELVVQRWGRLRVRVRDQDGRPVAGMVVSSAVAGSRTDRTGGHSHHERAITDPDGVAVLVRCPPGPNDVTAWQGRELRGETTAVVVPSEEREAEIVLAAPTGR